MREPFPHDELAVLYAAHRLGLVRLAVLLVDDLATAEDVVQDAFTSFAGAGQLRGPGAALGYLRTSVVNGARSALRRRRTARGYTPPLDNEPDRPDARAVLSEDHREVTQALQQLAPRQREVLVLRYWSELSEADIAGCARDQPRRRQVHRKPGARRPRADPGGPAMNTIEDRLTAALHARADLVQPEDLSRPAVPEVTESGRRPWVYAALAAACAAAIAVPLVVAQVRDGHGEPRPGSDVGTHWPLSDDRVEHDVDGDGAPDHLTLRVAEDGSPGPARLDVALSGGGTLYRVFHDEALEWGLDTRVDLDADGDDEILVSRDDQVLVLDLRDDQLAEVPNASGAPLSSGYDEELRLTATWVDEDLALMSSRSLVEFAANGDEITGPEQYEVEAWSWSLQKDGLHALKQPEPWCRDTSSGSKQWHPEPCPGSVPPIMREVSRTIGVGEIASLADPIPTLDLRRNGEQVVLDYALSGLQMSAPLPDRPGRVRAWVGAIDLGGALGFLVGWGQDPTEMAVYALVDGDLVELPFVADAPRLESSEMYYTFLTEDGTLYTRENVAPWDNQYRLWTWSMTDEGTLAPTDDGLWCLDYAALTAQRC